MSILNHQLPNYRIAVVGAGAVGCYYGGRLAQFGRDVHFLMRGDYEHVKRHGLRIRSKQGDAHLQKVQCYRTTEEIGPADLVLIALKATSNEALLTLLPPLVREGTMLLTLQNGLGNEEFLAEHFGAHRVLGGLCFVCINRVAPGVIHHIAQGQIALGEFSGYPQPRTHEVASEFKRCGIVCSVFENLMVARWRKLVWNIPFNGLSIAGGGIDTERILSSEPLEYLVRALMREIIDAACDQGFEIPRSLVEDQITRTKTMSAYKPSSLIDYLEGRDVEVEAIWGEPWRRAFNAGIPMPRLEALYHLIRHLVDHRTPAPAVES